jgi:outer membrane receptor protein involved in Fe transport
MDDEIYYSDINRNYDDKTIRQGIETDFSIRLTDTLRLWGNYTYTKAEFDEKETTIPLVPEHKASSGIVWKPMPALAFSFSGTYTGSRYDGNDTENNRYEKLDDFMVFDSQLSYEIGDFNAFVGIRNIFDELYETSAYSEEYYPMPERTIYGGIRWTCF